MKRREFLSATGVMFGAFGLSQSQLLGWQQALADSSRRKLALLIGIDHYAGSVSGKELEPLQGCVTDVELQRQLLIHRFGFAPSDIVMLIDGQATQSAIVQALYQLTQLATANDFVVVHFSGYGGQLSLGEKRIKTWVPADSSTAATPVSRDVPVSWVKQILARLKTKQVFTVVDAGYSEPDVALSSGYRSRARKDILIIEGIESPDLPEKIAADLGKLQIAAEPAFFPGDLLMAARDGQPVIEREWSDFGAGLFTYSLTRYLWTTQLPAQLSATMRGAQESILPLVPNQTPYWTTQTADEHAVYGGADLPCLDAVVTSVEGRSATLWLGGLPADVVQYSERFLFTRQLDSDEPSLMMRSQSGLAGRIKLTDSSTAWSVGQPLYEATRVLPKDITLIVALDSNLERIERVDATSALAALSFVDSTDDTRPADCVLGQPDLDDTTKTKSPPKSIPAVKQGYGLFTPTHALISDTLAKRDEAVKMAVGRLSSKLKTMLAMKLLRLSENQASSHLAIRLNLLLAGGETEKLLLQQETRQASGQASKSRLAEAVSRQNTPVEFSKGAQVRYQALNFSDAPLYAMLIGFDARDRMIAFFPPSDGQPYSISSLQTALTLAPGKSTSFPSQTTWIVDAPEGRVETYLVCSTSPLTHCWQELLAVANTASSQRVSLGERALPLVKALLNDLSTDDSSDNDPDSYTLNTAHWATVGCHYSIV